MRWATYFAVLASVLSVGLALGVSMPLVSLRLEGWGYGSFAIGVMAAMPAFGVLTGGLDLRHKAFTGLFDRQALVAHLLGRDRVYSVRFANLMG